jgi:hypothetical protein
MITGPLSRPMCCFRVFELSLVLIHSLDSFSRGITKDVGYCTGICKSFLRF